jgi:hypothetical protein
MLTASLLIIGCSGSASLSVTPTPPQERSPQASVAATLTADESSAGPFYLDGVYKLRFSVVHSSEQCLLVVYARSPGESIGTVLFSDVVFGNTGTFPVYRQSFSWDDAQFYGEDYTIVSEGACEEVRVELATLAQAPSSSPSVSISTPTPTASPTPTPAPTSTPSLNDIANTNVCSFVRATQARTSIDGSLPYLGGRISLRQMGSVYSEWAQLAREALRSNQKAKKGIKDEVNRLIGFATRTATAAKAGKGNTAFNLSLKVIDTKIYDLCGSY